jgi:hypothetical protein
MIVLMGSHERAIAAVSDALCTQHSHTQFGLMEAIAHVIAKGTDRSIERELHAGMLIPPDKASRLMRTVRARSLRLDAMLGRILELGFHARAANA